ncbi:MAG: NAD-dependent epimerase/dehydratase family protein [Promethearchaeota archaeon]
MSNEGKSKLIVTGGCGFIGSHLTRALVEQGDEVMVIDNLSSSTTRPIQDLIDSGSVEFHEVDIRDEEKLNGIISGKEKMFYHLAADPRVKESVEQPMESFTQNVIGTMNILEMMRLKGIKKMVFASSGGTLYGDVDKFPTPESSPLRPISPYGASKAAVEMYLSAYASSYSLQIVSLRFANIYGPGSTHGVMFDFYHKLKKDPNKLVILGDGTQSKSYLYVRDCVNAMLAINQWLDRQSEGTFGAFNLGTESWISVTQLAELMVEIMGLENVQFEYTGGKRGWVGDVTRNLLDIEKIKSIGWQPEVDIKTGLQAFLDSLQ